MPSGIPTYTPSLVFSQGRKWTFYSLADASYQAGKDPELCGRKCIYSCQGWLLLQSFSSNECYLYNPVSSEKIHLPLVPNTSYSSGVLTSTPSDLNCLAVLFSQTKNSIIFCRIGCTEWIEQKFIREENVVYEEDTGGDHLICCRGKVYIFRADKIEEINVHDTYATLNSYELGKQDAPSPEIVEVDEYIVESGGEIFQVLLGKSSEITRTCAVYKLDFSTMDRVMIEALGDHIFLLDVYSTASVSAKELGLKGNCVYFTDNRTTCVYRFDMDSTSITTSSTDRKLPHWKEPFWVLPNFTHKKVFKVRAPMVEPEDELQGERSWKYLPEELLELILSSLSGADIPCFRLTCKNWMRVRQHPRRFEPFLAQSNSKTKNLPWLLSLPRSKTGLCNFYYPIHNDVVYFINNLEIAGAVVRYAKNGWLLISQRDDTIFFFNPLTTETIKLPNTGDRYISISFSSPPTSSDCVVFGLLAPSKYKCHMAVFRKLSPDYDYEDDDGDADEDNHDDDNDESSDIDDADKFWSFKRYLDHTNLPEESIDWSVSIEVPHEFVPSNSCNSVFSYEKFFCLGNDGKLACCDPDEKDRERIWRVLPVPPVLSFSESANNEEYMTRSFLVANDDELYSVFIDHAWGKSVHVYKLDWDELRWVQVEDLGDYVLFLSTARSMLVPATIKGMGNRIYFPKFCGEDSIVYYSLSTRKYHFGSNSLRDNWTGSCEHWNCSWIDFSEQNFWPSKVFSHFRKICGFFKMF